MEEGMSNHKTQRTSATGLRDIDADSNPLVHFQRWFAEYDRFRNVRE
jgi:hypothetical protein